MSLLVGLADGPPGVEGSGGGEGTLVIAEARLHKCVDPTLFQSCVILCNRSCRSARSRWSCTTRSCRSRGPSRSGWSRGLTLFGKRSKCSLMNWDFSHNYERLYQINVLIFRHYIKNHGNCILV